MKERMNWIDALRGFTMFSVVAVHMLTYGFGVNPTSSTLCVLRGAFTLPLFFMVSGFFLYRPVEQWTRERLWGTLKVRFVAMVIGCFLFATLFEMFRHPKDPQIWYVTGYPGAYWFTFTLFQMFLYYQVSVAISRWCKRSLMIPLFVLSVVAPIFMTIINPFDGRFWSSWIGNKHTILYFQFVVAGMLIRKYQERVFGMLMNPWMLTILIIGFLSACVLNLKAAAPEFKEYSKWIDIYYWSVGKYCGAFLVINIFYYNREFFNGRGRFVSYWRKVGKRTLDIYYIHYFLLPQLYWVKPYISKGNTLLPELTLACLGAAIILVLSVAIGGLLRRAPLIRNLLGEKGMIPVQ